MLGVTMTSHMSASEHVSDVISRCAQSIHAVRTFYYFIILLVILLRGAFYFNILLSDI